MAAIRDAAVSTHGAAILIAGPLIRSGERVIKLGQGKIIDDRQAVEIK